MNPWSKKVRLGSVSILFTVIILCVAILAVLTVSTVQADQSLTQRYAQQVAGQYDLDNAGQEWLAQVSDALAEQGWSITRQELPEGTILQDGLITTQLASDGRTLSITLELTGSPDGAPKYQIKSWINSAQWEEDDQLNLFQ